MKKACLAVVLFAILAPYGGTRGASNPGGSEAVCSRSDVVFCEDWEDGDHVGWDWDSGWDSCMQIAGAGGYNSANAIKATFSGCECGYPSVMSGSYDVQNESLYQRFYYKVSAGYQWMPTSSTAQKVNYFMTDPISWRMMIGSYAYNGGGALLVDDYGHEHYYYHNGTAPKQLNSDQWYCIEMRLKGNTPGQANGSFDVWVDDVLYLSYSNVDLKSTGNPINRIPWLSHYYGGNPCPSHPTQSVWYDNLVVARAKIGCTGGGGDTNPPENVDNLDRTDTK